MQRPRLLTVSLALVAALTGCDEQAPTSTIEPAAPTELSSTSGDEAATEAVMSVSALAIALPVNQSVATTAPNPAFRVNQTGTGPNGIFQITRSTSTQTALQALTNGRGRAGFFQITNTANFQPALHGQTSGSGFAVQGLATGTGGAGSFVVSNTSNNNSALVGQTNGLSFAVRGIATGTGSAASFEVTNAANSRNALQGQTTGSGFAVRGLTTGIGGAGLFQINNASNGNPALTATTSGLGPAGAFQLNNASNSSNALEAVSNNRGPAFLALQGGSGPAAVIQIDNPSNVRNALLVLTNGTGPALQVIGRSTFDGNVTVNGTLTKTAGSFKIDHPLDPEHKYLSHSFVESPDMMNVYNGNVTLDGSGRATVELPGYFEALNRDFRYQLTAIGSPGPNLYIAEGVKQNHFRIAGGRAYAGVSWQVTGVRQDTYAEQHRIRVEEDKPRAGGELVAGR